MTNNTKTDTSQSSLPSRELWRALLTIYNHYSFAEELSRYEFVVDERQLPFPVLDAIRRLDCWLDIAVADGWLEGEAGEED